jgi:hypothetical protein
VREEETATSQTAGPSWKEGAAKSSVHVHERKKRRGRRGRERKKKEEEEGRERVKKGRRNCV